MKIKIRKLSLSDIEPLYRLLSDPTVMKYLEAPYSKEQTEKFGSNEGVNALIKLINNAAVWSSYLKQAVDIMREHYNKELDVVHFKLVIHSDSPAECGSHMDYYP